MYILPHGWSHNPRNSASPHGMVAALPLKEQPPKVKKKLFVDVLGSFYLFLTCNVNAAASGVIFTLGL